MSLGGASPLSPTNFKESKPQQTGTRLLPGHGEVATTSGSTNSLPGRLIVGQRPLKARMLVRFQPRQPISVAVHVERSFLAHPWAFGGPKARPAHPQRKNFKARAKLTTLQISMLPSSQPSELKEAPSNMTLRMASIKGVSGRIRR